MILFLQLLLHSFAAKKKRSARNKDLLTLESEEDYESLINYV